MKWLTNNRIILSCLSLILIAHVLVLTNLIFFPYPELFIYPYLTNQGLLPYKQIFDQHFPGLMFLPLNLNNLGMVNEMVARWWLIGVAILTQMLIFVIALKIFKDSRKAILASLLYLIWQPFLEGWVLWIDSFLPLFLLPAFYFTYRFVKEKTDFKTALLVGFFLSIGVLFKQVILPLSALVLILLFFYRINLKTIIYFLTGFLPLPIIVVIYYFKLGIIEDFWFWTVVFNLTTFAQFGRKSPSLTGIIRVAGIYSPLLLSLLPKDKKLAIVLLVFILGNLSGDIVRFDLVHFQPSLPFVVLATVLVFDQLWKTLRTRFIIAGYILVALVWLLVFYKGHLSDKVMFFNTHTYQISEKIKFYTKPQEEIFLFGPVPHLYQLSNTVPVGKIFVFQFPWFMMETEEKFLEVLKINQPNLVIRDKTVVIEGRPIVDFAKKLDEYINRSYQVIDQIENTEFLKRKDLL